MDQSDVKQGNSKARNFREHLIFEFFLLLVWAVCCGHFLLVHFRSQGMHFNTFSWMAVLTQMLILLFLLFLHGGRWSRTGLRQWVQEHPVRILTFLMVACAFLIFHEYIYGYRIFVFRDIGVDTTNQYVPVIFMMINKLKTGDLSFWEFNYGLGIDVLNSQSQICDPFNLIYYLLGYFLKARVVLYAIGMVQILKCMLCGWLAWLFLNEFRFTRQAKILASCTCAFSGYLMLWGQHYLMGTACVFLLLIIWLEERSLRNRENLPWFTLAVAGVLIFSVYIAYMAAVAAVVYLLVRVAMWKKDTGEQAGRILLQYLGAALAGFFLSAVIFLPVYYQQSVVSARLGEHMPFLETLFRPASARQYISALYRFYSDNLQGIADYYSGVLNYYEAPQLCFSAFFLPFLVLFYAEGIGYNKRRRAVYIITAAMLAFVILSPAGALLFNMMVNTATRYTFVLLPAAAYVLASVLSRLGHFHKIPIAAAWVAVIGSFAVFFLNRADLSADHLQGYLPVLCCLVAAGMFVVTIPSLKICRPETGRKGLQSGLPVLSVCLGILMLISAVWDGSITNNSRLTWDPEAFFTNRAFLPEKDSVLTEAAKAEQDIFRVEKRFSDFSVWNDAVLQNYSGISYYNTTYNKYVCEFIEQVWPEVIWDHSMVGAEYVQYMQDADNIQMASLLDLRYIYEDTLGEQRSLKNTGTFLDLGENKDTGVTLFENPEADGFGIVFEKTMDEDRFLDLPAEQRKEVLQDTLVVDDGTDKYGEYRADDENQNAVTIQEKNPQEGTKARREDSVSYRSESAAYYKNHAVEVRKEGADGSLTAEVDADRDGMLFVSIPYDSGWSAEVNGKKAEIKNADIGFQAVAIPAGKSTVTFHYETPLMKQGAALSLLGLLLFAAEVFCIRRKGQRKC